MRSKCRADFGMVILSLNIAFEPLKRTCRFQNALCFANCIDCAAQIANLVLQIATRLVVICNLRSQAVPFGTVMRRLSSKTHFYIQQALGTRIALILARMTATSGWEQYLSVLAHPILQFGSNQRRMTIRKGTIHIVQRMAPGGIELLVRDLASQLPGENRIFSLDGTRKQIITAWPALEPHAKQIRGFSKKPGINPGLLLSLRNTFKQLKPHAVITHHVGPLVYGGLAARLANVPVIAHVEHDVWHYGHPRRRLLTRAICSVVRPRIVGVSMTAADTVAAITGAKNVRVITNGVDTKRFTPENKAEVRKRWNIPENAPVVGAVGRLEIVKGHDVLLDAMIGLPDNVMCVLVGAGSQMTALKEKAKALGIENQVMFLGNVSDTSSIYSAFDVLCQPSRAEGLPLTILEAQSCGVPVVATDVGSVRDAVCPDIGRVVAAEEPEIMAVSLLEMLREKELSSPRAFVSENFSWNNTLSSYTQLVKA